MGFTLFGLGFFQKAVETDPENVGDVYVTFTNGLQKVTEKHRDIANEARDEQEVLESALEIEQLREKNAEAQVSQAAQGMKNIGELLGITPKEAEDGSTK
jgi:response regulator RpfG family c-di-GMP phosphodiesterase